MAEAVESWVSSLPGYATMADWAEKIGNTEGSRLAAGAVPMVAVALTACFVFGQIKEHFRENAALLKHQQTAEAYHGRFNASVIGVGVLAFALKALEAAGAFAIALTGASIGCGVFAAVMLSNWVYQRSLAHSGSRVTS